MNEQKAIDLINKTIADLHKQIGGKAARKQYAPAKHQIAKLEALGILHLMPKKFGYNDAAAVIADATDDGKTVGGFNAAGEGDVMKLQPSPLYQALHETNELKPRPTLTTPTTTPTPSSSLLSRSVRT